MRELEIKASSVGDAIAKGLSELGVTQEQVDIEVIAKGGFLKKAVVKLTVKEVQPTVLEEESVVSETAIVDNKTGETPLKSVALGQDEEAIVNFIGDVLNKMELNCEVSGTSQGDTLFVRISGEDAHFAIGYRGETLDSLQYLALLCANKHARFRKKLVIDAEDYRQKREQTLIGLSKKLAYKVSKTGRAIELEPMNPYERRIIHTALQNNKFVETASEGEEPNRFVVINPKNAVSAPKDEDVSANMYERPADRNFKKNGIKTRSFGQKKRRF